jgi:cytochrome b subunit of formate dehydrogenase
MKKSQTIKRWGVVDRVTHWLLFAGVLLAVITGLPLFSPEIFGFANQLLPSRAVTNSITGPHLGGAILLIAAALLHFAHALVKKRTAILPTRRDFSDFIAIIRHWFDASKEYPPLGFHHPGEKTVYWGGAVIGLALLGTSGIMLWLTDMCPSCQTLALVLHDIGFGMTSVLVLGHFLLGLTRRNWPVLRAMFITGVVPISWIKPRHSLWIEETAK